MPVGKILMDLTARVCQCLLKLIMAGPLLWFAASSVAFGRSKWQPFSQMDHRLPPELHCWPAIRSVGGRAPCHICNWPSAVTGSAAGRAPGHAMPGLLDCPQLPHVCCKHLKPVPCTLVPAQHCIQLLSQSCNGLAHAHLPALRTHLVCMRAVSPS